MSTIQIYHDSKSKRSRSRISFFTQFSYQCQLCTPDMRRAYGDHCPHSAKRYAEQQALAKSTAEWRDPPAKPKREVLDLTNYLEESMRLAEENQRVARLEDENSDEDGTA